MQADATVSQRQERVAEVTARTTELGALDTTLTAELAGARRQLREFAVAAYIDGGQSELFRSSLSPEQSSALAWQKSLSVGGSSAADDAAERFASLKEANTPERLAVAADLDTATRELEEARFDAIQAAAFERDAEAALADARQVAAAAAAAASAAAASAAAAERAQAAASASAVAAQRSDSSSSAAPSSSATPSPVTEVLPSPGGGSAMGGPTAAESATLARIRACESRGNYSIVSASGRYRGAYQFDYATWAGVGGSGDPAAASPAEQDYRALLLLRQRGTRPWPNCGR